MKLDPDDRRWPDPAIRALIDRANPSDLAAVNARRVLCAYGEWGAPLITSGRLGTWLELWERGMRPAIESANTGDAYENSLIARAALRLAGHLHGPEFRLRDGLRVAVGDQLVVATDYRPGTTGELPGGILLDVTDVHPVAGFVTVDIPTIGETRHIPAGSSLARAVTYGYATTPTLERALERPGPARQPAQGLTW